MWRSIGPPAVALALLVGACGDDGSGGTAAGSGGSEDMDIDEATRRLHALVEEAAEAGAPGVAFTTLPERGPAECTSVPAFDGGPVSADLSIDIPKAGTDRHVVLERIAAHWRDRDLAVEDRTRSDDVREYVAVTGDDFTLRVTDVDAQPVVRVSGQTPCVDPAP